MVDCPLNSLKTQEFMLKTLAIDKIDIYSWV